MQKAADDFEEIVGNTKGGWESVGGGVKNPKLGGAIIGLFRIAGTGTVERVGTDEGSISKDAHRPGVSRGGGGERGVIDELRGEVVQGTTK